MTANFHHLLLYYMQHSYPWGWHVNILNLYYM